MSVATSNGCVEVSERPNIRLFYTIDGPLDGSRDVLVLSNSLAATTQLWDEFVSDFVPEYTVLRYDARFHGKSPLTSEPGFDYAKGHTIEDLADDVIKILDHLKIKKVKAIVGLSIGAAGGLIVGAKHPHRVEHVVVVGTRARSNPDSNAAHTYRIKFGYENGPLALGRQSIARWFDEGWRTANPEKAAHAEEIYCKQSIEGYEASIAALRPMDLMPFAADIGKRGDGGRFAFVAGEWDGNVPQESNELADQMGSEVFIVTESGHITPIQQPKALHDIVRKVIA